MKNVIVVQEDDGLFNIFDRAMFDEDGHLEGFEGVEGYNIADMDIVAEFDTLKQAEYFIECYKGMPSARWIANNLVDVEIYENVVYELLK